MPYTLQYDMGLRVWVLNGPDGQVMDTYLSRSAALKDVALRRMIEHGMLRIRNADGSFEPADRLRSVAATSTRATTPTPVLASAAV